MKTSKNTVLITGGSAGIGFEIARLFDEKDNHVIIVGRNEARLAQAAAKLKNVTAIAADVSNEADVNRLAKQLQENFPNLNVVVNNAGRAFAYHLNADSTTAAKAEEEFRTNFFAVLNLTDKLLPQLQKQPEAAIVNVSSIVAFAPNSFISTYSASKAALHSYTKSLRIALEKTGVKVFELMPPLVNTEFSEGIGGAAGIAPSVVAEDLVDAIENDRYEIRVGNTENIYQLYRSSPADALAMMNAGE